MTYKVTLAMPVYNVAPYIKDSLLSALNQNFDGLEILLLDDKGNDGSLDIVKEILRTHPQKENVRIIDQKINQGPGLARNRAIEEARGEYILFMDSDDRLSADCVRTLYQKAMEYPQADIIAGNTVYITPSGEKSYPFHKRQFSVLDSPEKVMNFYVNPDTLMGLATWNKLFKISFLNDFHIRNKEHRILEDRYFFIQECMNARFVVALEEITYYYLIREGSTSNSDAERYSITRSLLLQRTELITDCIHYVMNHPDSLARVYGTMIVLEHIRQLLPLAANCKYVTYREKRKIITTLYDPELFQLAHTSGLIKKRLNNKRYRILFFSFKLPALFYPAFWIFIEKIHRII